MALSAVRDVPHVLPGAPRVFKIAANKKIYKGAMVNVDANGYAQPATGTTKFLGIAYETVDNTGGSNGDKSVRVVTEGDHQLPLSGAAQADIGKALYASDDATTTLTSSGNCFIGFIIEFSSSGVVVVRLDTYRGAP